LVPKWDHRISGKVCALNLPDFDNHYSAASWYRDYAAYCRLSDDGKKAFAVVAQIGRRKPGLKKLGDAAEDDIPTANALNQSGNDSLHT